MKSKALLVFKKEIYRVTSDKKMLFSLYILPVIIIFIMYTLIGKLISSMENDINSHEAVVTVVNAGETFENIVSTSGYDTMAKISYIDEAEYTSKKDSLENAVLEGDSDLIVYMPLDFEKGVSEYISGASTIPTMKVFYNNTESYSSNSYSVFSQVVQESLRNVLLTERYGDLELLDAFGVEEQIICKEEKANTEFISMMLPYMIIIMLFSGVMSVGVDAISGEKERGTLASMLISPIKRSELVTGKLLGMAVLAGVSALVYCVAMIAVMPMMGEGLDGLGFAGVSFSVLQCVELVVIMLVLVYFYVGIIGLVSAITPNVKTASSVISPVYIVIIMAGMSTMFRTGSKISSIFYAIPVYGNALAISDLCAHDLTITNFLLSAGGTFVVGAILTILIAKAFNNEKLMYNA